MNRPEKRKLERVKYWQGQMLRARDFRDLEAIDAQRRWWHNRALHNAYGVSEGLNCSLVPANSPFTAVSVSPGVAYDIFGRELILERPQTIPLPSNLLPGLVGAVSLLIRYKAPSGNLPPDEISEVCWTQTGSIRPGTVEFAWKLTSNFKPIDGVSIFGVSYFEGTPTGPDLNYFRLSTRPLAGPLLATGATVPGNTPWEQWYSPAVGEDGVQFSLGVETTIDTSGAGFTQIPCYFAWLGGSIWNPQTLQLVPAFFPSITDESLTSFNFCLSFFAAGAFTPDVTPLQFIGELDDFTLFAQQQKLYVRWIGCQMPNRFTSKVTTTATAQPLVSSQIT
jgi:hypothetical protein